MTATNTPRHALLEDEDRVRAALASDVAEAHRGWADGFGIVAPDVTRYSEVLRAVPDAILLAMRNVASAEHIEMVDPDTATLVGLLARMQRPARVLEIGTGIGYLTLHLARAVPEFCTITSIETNPVRQAQAHAFLGRDDHACAVELRLGDPQRMRTQRPRDPIDLVVLGDASLPRIELLDRIVPHLAYDALVLIPFALRGGEVADAGRAWEGEDELVEAQRALNRCVATDPRFMDVALLPVGDGLLLARHRSPR